MNGVRWIDRLLQEKMPPPFIRLMHQAGVIAAEKELSLYLVGGIVRDLLLGYPPEYDYDLVVAGDAGIFAKLLQEQVGGRISLYPRYLTATIKLGVDLNLDLVTARRESYSKPGALPYVEASDIRDDLNRRDFSINALACSLLPSEWGMLYDYCQGYEDLQKKIIRIMQPGSFFDDPLRIIRAIRFEQRYKFVIESMTLSCLVEAVKADALALVDTQRLAREVKKIYLEPRPQEVTRRLHELGVDFRR